MEDEKLRLWRLFIVGRSAVTGVFLALLVIVNGFALPVALRPLFLVASIQFAANGMYFYLWKRRNIAFMGYFCFVLEIALITLLILSFGPGGYIFVLAYLWPIIMGGWLIGHQATLPLTLLSSIVYGLIVFLAKSGITPAREMLASDGIPQALALCLPYLAFIALLVWALTSEIERGEGHLKSRNQELHRINTNLRSLVTASEQLLSCLDLQQLFASAVVQVREITGHTRVAIYAKEGDVLRLKQQQGLPLVFEQNRKEQPFPEAWLNGREEEMAAVLQEPLERPKIGSVTMPDSIEAGFLTHVALRSPHGLEGMLTVLSSEGAPLDQQETQILQILGHQLGIALENAQLFDDLQHERNLLRGILANMAEGVFVADYEASVLLTNRATTNLLGIRQGEPLPPWFVEQIAAGEGADTAQNERLIIDYEGKIISLSIAELAVSDGMPPSTIYVARDITQEAQVERMKSDFVAYVSHELRTPLTTIKMMVRLLLMDTSQDSKPHEYLTVIATQVDRQKRLINNLLDLARLEAGKYDFVLEEVNPRQVVQSVARVCRLLAAEKGLTMDISCSQAPDSFVSNGSGLEQVLINLVSNAIKFTDQGGQIAITCRRDGDGVLFTVEDSGIGMTQEQLDRIFTKFYTVRNPHKRGEGTGLGLAISNMIIQKLGGYIKVTSEVGIGSRFSVHIPLTVAGPQ